MKVASAAFCVLTSCAGVSGEASVVTRWSEEVTRYGWEWGGGGCEQKRDAACVVLVNVFFIGQEPDDIRAAIDRHPGAMFIPSHRKNRYVLL